MKTRTIFTILIAAFLLGTVDANCQVKINLKKKIKKEADKRANEKTNKGVKKGFDELEKGIKGLLTGEDSVKAARQEAGDQGVVQGQAAGERNAGVAAGNINETEALTLSWSKYDFVPGDKIIFEDNLTGEENGEFPSRWDLVQGTVENARFGDDNIIMFRGGSPMIIPYLKNPDTDYLPEVFTVGFDLYVNNHNHFQVYFYDRKNQKASSDFNPLAITYQRMRLGPASSYIPDKGSVENEWAHISIAYTNGKMKAYINETRLINIPHLGFDPMGISLYALHASDENQFFIKNFRLAEGGVKYYDRFLQDGKIVSNGIRFDVGKATLRPESMGVINEIYKMLSEHPEVNVSIEGHTDSDGDTDLNQKLSEDRAATVMKQLVSMGLSKDRLSFRGYGESKPVAPNDSPEGKASNRRVEFVKK
ncbi:MAG: OmpA family protein [Bacteroidales bacterium]|nr:OmpA family protein [Bacteroidales bacterium]